MRAAIYCRISRDDKSDEIGVATQRKDCLKRIEREGWTVVGDGEADTWTDNDISGGKDATERAAFGRLIKAIEAGQIDVVVATAQARIFRDTIKFLEFYNVMQAGSVERLALVNETDVTIGGSRFVPTIIAANDEEYRRYIGEQVRRRLLDKAEKGEPTGGPRPFGFKANRIEVDEAEAALIREAANKILEGGSLRSIAIDWNARGFRSTRNHAFSYTTVKRILLSARVAGLRQHQGVVLGKAQWPAILDETTWKQVAVILSDTSRRMPRASQDYPLRGIVTCALCGSFLSAAPRPSGRHYTCKKDTGGCSGVVIKADHLERYVYGLILPLLDHPYLRDVVRSEDEHAAEEARQLVLQNAEDETKLLELGDMWADDEIDRQAYLRQRQRLSGRIEERQARLASFHGRSALSSLGYEGISPASWQDLPSEDKRSIIRALVGRIEISKTPKPGRNTFDPERVSFGQEGTPFYSLPAEMVGWLGIRPVKTIQSSTMVGT